MSLATAFHKQLKLRPSQPSLRFGGQVYTWIQVAERLKGAVAHIRSLELGDRTTLATATDDPFTRVLWMLAGSWCGHVWLLSGKQVGEEPSNVVWLHASIEASSEELPEPAAWLEDDVHWLLRSSGTTGQPKLISLSWLQIEANARGAEQRFGLTSSDSWLCVLPLGHIAGASIIARSFVVGLSVSLSDFCADTFSDTIDLHGVTVASVVPTMLGRVLARSSRPPASLRILMVGGAAFPRRLAEQAEDWPVWLTWGMSETASQIATSPMKTALEEGLEPIADTVVSVDQDQYLCVRGPIAPGGYWQTSDLGELSASGKVRVHGRGDDVVKVGGNRINLARVKRIFEEEVSAVDLEVFAVSEDDLGVQVGLAYRQGTDGILESLTKAAEALEVWERPHWLMPMLELPLNHRFKVDRGQIAAECEVRRKQFGSVPGRMTFLPGDQLLEPTGSVNSTVYRDSEGRLTL